MCHDPIWRPPPYAVRHSSARRPSYYYGRPGVRQDYTSKLTSPLAHPKLRTQRRRNATPARCRWRQRQRSDNVRAHSGGKGVNDDEHEHEQVRRAVNSCTRRAGRAATPLRRNTHCRAASPVIISTDLISPNTGIRLRLRTSRREPHHPKTTAGILLSLPPRRRSPPPCIDMVHSQQPSSARS